MAADAGLKLQQPTLFVGLGGVGSTIVNRIAGILKAEDDAEQYENIYQYFVLDTDRAMIDDCPNIPLAHKFIISGFDKGLYSALKRGRVPDPSVKADARVVQWMHDWYNFRSSRGAGAGQIRVESRVSIYNALETTDLIGRIEKAIAASLSHTIPNVDVRTRSLRVFIYFSVAGGTGSGCNLTLAYIIRHVAEQFGLSANITAVAALPTLLKEVIRNHRQRGDILCNGYASLMETEHLQRLKVTSDARDPSNIREFVFHPHDAQTTVTEAPFDFCYLVDTPPDLTVGPQWREVVADGVYLQITSPIYAVRNSDYDNYEKNQKRFSRGLYSTFYGAFGCSVLLLPDRKILEYCALRQAQEVFERYFSRTNKSSDGKTRFPTEDEEQTWQGLPESRRNRNLDLSYVDYCVHEGGLSGPDAGDHERRVRTIGADRARLKSLKGELVDEELEVTRRASFMSQLRNYMSAVLESEGDSAEGDAVFYKLRTEAFRMFAWNAAADMMWDVRPADQQLDSSDEEDEDYEEDEELAAVAPKPIVYRNWRNATHTALFGPTGLLSRLERITQPRPAPPAPAQELRRMGGARAVDECRKAIRDDATALLTWMDEMGAQLRRFAADVRGFVGDGRGLRKLVTEEGKDPDIDLLGLRLFFILLREELVMLRGFCESVRQHPSLGPTRLENVTRELKRLKAGKVEEMQGWDSIRKEAPVTKAEAVRGVIGDSSQEHERFRAAWENNFVALRDEWAGSLKAMYYADGMASACGALVEQLNRFLTTVREFSAQADHRKADLQRSIDAMVEGGDGDSIVVNVEALTSLNNQRLWGRYYDHFVRDRRRLDSRAVIDVLTTAFTDPKLAGRVDDIASHIREQCVALSRENLRDTIVGRYRTGTDREKRGLLIDEALAIEAELCFLDHLKKNGRLEDVLEVYRDFQDERFGAQDEDREVTTTASVQAFRAELERFTADYLDMKMTRCVRTSGVMANIEGNDPDVAEFSCRQAIMAYDLGLYGKPMPDGSPLRFPNVVARIAPETIDKPYGDAKKVIFYQAVLGVPLFAFTNVRGELAQAYRTRVRERNPTAPYTGRQYPLHIDRNWEPGELDCDPRLLPLSLDPDEASAVTSEEDAEQRGILRSFLGLLFAGEITWSEDSGFVVPPGKVDNPAEEPVYLGHTLRTALTAIEANAAAAAAVQRAAAGKLPDETALERMKAVFADAIEPDTWGNADRPPADFDEAIELLEGLLEGMRADAEAAERRAREAAVREQAMKAGGGRKAVEEPA